MKLNIKIHKVWNSANPLFKWRFDLLSSGNFATMAMWRNDFSSLFSFRWHKCHFEIKNSCNPFWWRQLYCDVKIWHFASNKNLKLPVNNRSLSGKFAQEMKKNVKLRYNVNLAKMTDLRGGLAPARLDNNLWRISFLKYHAKKWCLQSGLAGAWLSPQSEFVKGKINSCI